MSRAFTKEPDADFVEDLPQRPISEHPNEVTEHGLRQIEAAVARARSDLAAAQAADERNRVASASRDLHYWSSRYATARVALTPIDTDRVAFGHRVTIERDDGRRQTFQIVGEDEADPKLGSISHVSPLARALLGKTVGDVVVAGRDDAEIISITK